MKIMKRPRQLIRLFQINIILLKNRLDRVVLSTESLRQFSFISYFNPWHWLNKENKPRGESIRLAFEQLGPIFVKFGQVLSTRRDLIPNDIADELEKLQDKVPPFSGSLAKNILENYYKKPITEIFAAFDETPLASASIAQVHAAILKSGEEVVVKIIRPNIEKTIHKDMSLIYSVAKFTEKFFPHGDRLRAIEVVAELEKSLTYELDLLHEGANASQLRRNFLNSSLLYIPQVFWEYSSQRILVMEKIAGIPISDVKTLKQAGINLKELAEKGVEIFFTQVLRDSFFHADMHPGNIFINKKNPENPQYIAVDFGIMGTLSPTDQRYLAENLLAFFRRDYRRVAELHIESGWVGKIRIDELETAIRGVCEPIFERPLKDISIGKLLLKIFQATRKFQMDVQPQFFLLQKTMLNVEGLGRQLYPDLDLWSTAKPYLEKWVRQQIGPRAMLKKIYQQAPSLINKMLVLPDLLEQYLQKTNPQQNFASLFEKATDQRKNDRRKKWLGFGMSLLALVILNFTLGYSYFIHRVSVNLILGIIGLAIIFRNS